MHYARLLICHNRGYSISGSVGKFGESFQGLEVVQGAEVWVAKLLEQRQSPLVVPGTEGGGDLRLVLLLPRRRDGVGFSRSERQKAACRNFRQAAQSI